MTQNISNDHMANVRQSLAQAGIYFDKLYINQAYFNSNFTIQTPVQKQQKSKSNFWHKLLCGSGIKKSSMGTQTVLTVRDDSDLKPPTLTRRARVSPTQNTYDRRRYYPTNREYTHKNCQLPIRRRRSSLVSRSVQSQRQKQTIDNEDEDDDDDDQFAV